MTRFLQAVLVSLVAGLLAHAGAAAQSGRGAELDSASVSLCSIALTGSSGTTVEATYAGLPGNQPHTYGNYVAYWQSSVVPWTVAPAARLGIPLDVEVGTVVLMGVTVLRSPSTMAYAVGPRIGDICASALLRADGTPGPTDAVALTLTSIGTTSLSLRYHTLSGYLPATSGNWIGVWRGRASPYNPPPALARVKVPEDVTDGEVAIEGVPLTPGNVFTIIYFMGDSMTTAAVLLTGVVPARS